jgi:hypothetical protein
MTKNQTQTPTQATPAKKYRPFPILNPSLALHQQRPLILTAPPAQQETCSAVPTPLPYCAAIALLPNKAASVPVSVQRSKLT